MTGCYDDLVTAGVRTRDAAALMGLSKATQDRRRSRRQVGQPADPAARPVPVNKLSDAESAELIAVLNSQRFVDKAPPQIYATLLAEGTYLCSISTMYRTLERNRQVKDRRRQATHPPRKVPELQATGPRQVYSWDITKLAGPVKGQYFDCYVMIDIYSRYIVGAHVHNSESAALAVDLMRVWLFWSDVMRRGVGRRRGSGFRARGVVPGSSARSNSSGSRRCCGGLVA